MIKNNLKIHELISSKQIIIKNPDLKNAVQIYSIYLITESKKIEKEEIKNIENNIKESKLMIISQYEKNNEGNYLILGFEKTLIFFEQSPIAFFHDLLSANNKIPVCFLVNKMVEVKNPEINPNPYFLDEIKAFKQQFLIPKSTKDTQKLYSDIITCISGYLIKKAYLKLTKNRIEKFLLDLEDHWISKTIKESEYIELRIVGKGCMFMSKLIYYIEFGELCVIKKPNEGDSESSKLVQRETSNYKKILHPFIPKYYGEVKNTNYFVIEFINGLTLDKINKDELNYEEKIKIIFELMTIIKYLHDNKLIYRDLKPNNIIINENKDAVLIDFDRLIEYNSEISDHTIDSAVNFSAPEISMSRLFSYKSDIYSLGKVISYIIDHNIKSDEFSKMSFIVDLCLNEIAEKRPSISDLIIIFTSHYQSKVSFHSLLDNYANHLKFIEDIIEICKIHDSFEKTSKTEFKLGSYYYKTQNIEKSIHYLSLAADKNNPKAQYNLGQIYSNGKYITRDINKAIHYYSLAADLNNAQAQYVLGLIYYNGKYITRDINKAIHYYSLAADLNNSRAQYILGFIYYDGKYITRDINKAIHYYTLAADQNDLLSQYRLGLIYYEGKDILESFIMKKKITKIV